jgi:hypothetical protein
VALVTTKAYREDRGEQLRSPVRTPQGFLRVDGYVSRAGIYEYVNKAEDAKYGAIGTIRRELRSLEEVSRQDALAGFEGAPLTANHPTQQITSSNVRAYEIGTATARARMDGDRVAASMMIKDPNTIAKVESGELAELSPGYKALIIKQPGTDKRYATLTNPEGRYDCIQTDIEINHLALVPRARGGSDLRIRMDGIEDAAQERQDAELMAAARGELGNESFAVPDGRKLPIENEAHIRAAMSRFSQTEFSSPAEKRSAFSRIVAAAHKFGIETTGFEQAHRNDSAGVTRERQDGMADMTAEEQVRALKLQFDEATKTLSERKDAIDAVTAEREAARAELKTHKETIADLTGKLAAGATAMETQAISLQAARADAAETKLAKLESERERDIRTAAEVRIKAMAMMGPEFRVDGMQDRAIKVVVIKRFAPNEEVGDAVSPAYIDARFDSLVEARMANARSLTRASEVLTPGVKPEVRLDSKEARAKAWREQALNPKAFEAAFGLKGA